MRKILTPIVLFFCALSFIEAQTLTPLCGPNAPVGASSCPETCVRCLFDDVYDNNYTSSGTGQGSCNGQLIFHNPRWYAFIAGSTDISFEVLPLNTSNGNGLQALIYGNCSDPYPLACNPGVAGGAMMPVVVSSNFLIPGNTYYLVVDGYNAEVCDFHIEVISGSTTAPAPAAIGQIQGPSHMCSNTPVGYSIPSLTNAGTYTWTAPTGSSINGGGNVLSLDAYQGGTYVNVTFGNASGTIQVEAGNQCFPSQSTSKAVLVAPMPPTELPPLSVDYNNLPFTWSVDGTSGIGAPGLYHLTATFNTQQNCDSIVKQEVYVNSPNGSATVYWDVNGNGVVDAPDVPSSGNVVKVGSGAFFPSVDGYVQLFNLSSGDTVRVIPPYPGAVIKPAFAVAGNAFFSKFFLITPPPGGVQDLSIDLTNVSVFRPGFFTEIVMTLENKGANPISNAEAKVHVAPPLIFDGSNWAHSIVNDTITWAIGKMESGEKRVIRFTVYTPIGEGLGTPALIYASALPLAGDSHPVNNQDLIDDVIMGSYDPNDKKVDPQYVTPKMLAEKQPFEYTIRFQNTGTYYAEFVNIVDPLSYQLDLNSIRLVSSSHPCTWKIGANRTLRIFFNEIFLPDSTHNEPQSHGFVKFSIMPNPGVGVGARIENFCDIYFDFNSPIRTNTASTDVVYFTPGEEPEKDDQLILRPNPAAFFLMCNWQTPAPAAGTLRLYNLTGQQRLEVSVAEGDNYQLIDLQDVPSGIYIAVLDAGGVILVNKAVVIKDVGQLGN